MTDQQRERPDVITPLAAGTRVCILEGIARGKLGYVRAHRMVERGGNRIDMPLYLVTEIMPAGPGVGDWWAEVYHGDVSVVQEYRP